MSPDRSQPLVHQGATPRYHVGCAGQFMLGQLTGYTDDRDEAFVMCLDGPVGCEVYDSVEDKWLGPTCMEEIEMAQRRLVERAS